MKGFLSFHAMLTPIIIQIIFWIGVAACVIAGVVMIAVGKAQGLLIILLGPIGVRVYCEILIVFFRINDTLMDIKHLLERRPVEQRVSEIT
ncbi:MAG: DUF4282 domain-containing protein [Deltaproteobacteria bacterium]|nr:DUF4282 domain-containing protein [Deltaproteobacteria bacterium]